MAPSPTVTLPSDKFICQSKELGENFLLGKNSGWNSVSAGVVALRMHIAMPSLGAEFRHHWLRKCFRWIRFYNDFYKVYNQIQISCRFHLSLGKVYFVDVFHFVVCSKAQMVALGRLSQLQKAYDLFKARFQAEIVWYLFCKHHKCPWCWILWNEEWLF